MQGSKNSFFKKTEKRAKFDDVNWLDTSGSKDKKKSKRKKREEIYINFKSK